MQISKGVLTPSEPAIDLVRILSEGTYTSFPQALKEFVSNSFDADASRVEIRVDDDFSVISIRDDGEGMTKQDFGEAFASIARSGRSNTSLKRGRTKSGRVKIGRFGVGTLAVVSICDRMTVSSTKEGFREGFVAQINLAEVRQNYGKGENISDWWKFQFTDWNTELPATHFTEIRLEGLNADVRAFLERPGEKQLGEEWESVTQLSGIEQLTWYLGLICPVAYEDGFPIPAKEINKATDSMLIEHSRRLIRNKFQLWVNGVDVKRRISLPKYKLGKAKTASPDLLERGLGWELRCFSSPRQSRVRYEGYVIVQAKQLVPKELRGLLVRMRGVAIGTHQSFRLAGGSIATMLPAMSGEIWVESGLDEALQFDRESFREDHPNFQLFKDYIEKEIESESRGFRRRSQRRLKDKPRNKDSKGKTNPGSTSPPPGQSVAIGTPTGVADAFLDPGIFKDCPPHIAYLVPQINGSWDRGWLEACALVNRKLLETLIIWLFHERGWADEIRDSSNAYFGLQVLVDKVCGDARFKFSGRETEGLRHLKAIGDEAAHDFKVRIRRNDLKSRQRELRLACERLIFIARNQGSISP